MSEFTAKGLVKYCKDALNLKTVYMWGGLMKTVTKTFIDYKKKQYPAYYSDSRVALLETKIGNYYGCDCVGLIKSYLFGGVNSPKYKSKWDTNTRGMYSVSKTKGTIDTLPEQEGLILYMKGHVGVYIGNGECIECTLGKYGDGVVKTKVAGRGWTHWLMLPWLDYEDGVTAEEPECKCECACCKKKKKKNDELSVWVNPLSSVDIYIKRFDSPGSVVSIFVGTANLNSSVEIKLPNDRYFLFSSKLNGVWSEDSDFEFERSISSGAADIVVPRKGGVLELYYGDYKYYFEALGTFALAYIEDGANYMVSDIAKIIRDLDYAAYFRVYGSQINFGGVPADNSSFSALIYKNRYRVYEGEILELTGDFSSKPSYVFYCLELVCLGKGLGISFKVSSSPTAGKSVGGYSYGTGVTAMLSRSSNRGAYAVATAKLKSAGAFYYNGVE